MKLIPVIHEKVAEEGYPQKQYTTIKGRKYEVVTEPGDEQKEPAKKYTINDDEVVTCMLCMAQFMAYDRLGLQVHTFCPCCGGRLVEAR
jgi:hypothetical protein